ncbi:MAG: multicopper oxidase domain-containing protein, partial [Rhodothermales bacterium]|nr:multicopper oxidase domain-containing protein [Rhodothermales bacterium]
MRHIAFVVLLFATFSVSSADAQPVLNRLLAPGTSSAFPLVVANDNRTAAGTWHGDTLDVDLNVALADWRVETRQGPGLVVAAAAEQGGDPMIPAPLIRAPEGTIVRARVTNALGDSTLTVFGLQTRPAEEADSVVIGPGRTEAITFAAGQAGTYLYRIRIGDLEPSSFSDPEMDQLAGAFIVDPAGGSPPDRVLVMNVWSRTVDSSLVGTDYIEGLTINGKSWPYTERERPHVGDTLRWRVINATGRNHPMHLHG